MAWIELHQTLPTNKKTLRLKSILKISQAQAIGHLCMLWLWALDNAPDGNLSELYSSEISTVSGWDKDPDEFVDALIKSGFIDENKALHNWYEYAGRLIEKREANKNRMKNARAERIADCADVVQRTCNAQDEHVQDTCSACAGATVPYRTVPYTTVPNQDIHGGVVEDSANPDENINEPVENYEDGVKTEFVRAWGRLPTQQEATKAIGLIVNLCGEVTDDGIEILGNALDSCADHNAKTTSYLSGIFKNLKERGIKTADDYYGYDIERSRRKKKSG